MSTVSTRQPPQPPSDEPDPYRYGWRHVRVERPDGKVEFDQVPLTLEDVLFPEVGDFIVQTTLHNRDIVYLKSVFESRLAGNLGTEVVSDCRVDWDLPGVRPLGPDIAVFLGLARHRDWSTFEVAVERARPAMVAEVTSPETRRNDVEDKFEYYRRARVPLYVIVDAIAGRRAGPAAPADGLSPGAGAISPARAGRPRLDLAGSRGRVAGGDGRSPDGMRPSGLLRSAGP